MNIGDRIMRKHVFAALAAGIMIAGCSGKKVHDDEHAAAPPPPKQVEAAKAPQPESIELGRVQSAEGAAPVTMQRRVMLRTTSKIPTVRRSMVVADINRMDESHFEAMGFSPEESRDIIRYRKDHGGFQDVEELASVPGIDEEKFDRIKPKLGMSKPGQAKRTG
jgi:hypothetical protein